MAAANPRPILVVYKEVVSGDLRKFEAKSNDSSTGGGARDLRFPFKTFRPVMHRIFVNNSTGRGGRAIRTASVIYLDHSGVSRTTTLEYWPPTPSRKTEDRIARVHESPAFGGRMPLTTRGRIFVLLILFDDGSVRAEYLYEDELTGGPWASEITSAIRTCLATTASKNFGRTGSLVPVQGYYEFGSGMQFCHAD